MNPILECIDLTKKFGTKEALSEVNCQLPRGRRRYHHTDGT